MCIRDRNYVGTVTNNGSVTYRGHKLVIRFSVKPQPGFLGGNNVPTNAGAGVYENKDSETPVREFPQPTVNVPIPVSYTHLDVYKRQGILSPCTIWNLSISAERLDIFWTSTRPISDRDLTSEGIPFLSHGTRRRLPNRDLFHIEKFGPPVSHFPTEDFFLRWKILRWEKNFVEEKKQHKKRKANPREGGAALLPPLGYLQ